MTSVTSLAKESKHIPPRFHEFCRSERHRRLSYNHRESCSVAQRSTVIRRPKNQRNHRFHRRNPVRGRGEECRFKNKQDRQRRKFRFRFLRRKHSRTIRKRLGEIKTCSKASTAGPSRGTGTVYSRRHRPIRTTVEAIRKVPASRMNVSYEISQGIMNMRNIVNAVSYILLPCL